MRAKSGKWYKSLTSAPTATKHNLKEQTQLARSVEVPLKKSLYAILLTGAQILSLSAGAAYANETPAVEQKCGTGVNLASEIDELACTRLDTLIEAIDRKPSKKAYVARQRAELDAEQMRTLLISEGYFATSVTPQVLEEEGNLARFQVTPGKRFRIRETTITYEPAARVSSHGSVPVSGEALPQTLADAGIEDINSPRANDIVAAEKAVLDYLKDHGRPWASLKGHEVRANFDNATAHIIFTFDAGPLCTYGPLRIEGAERLDTSFIRALISFRQEKPCSLTETEEARAKLARTGLFAATEVKPDRSKDQTTPHPVLVRVKEAKARSVGLGFFYATNRGLGGRAYWEHRNLLGRAERLHVELNIEEIKQEGEISFRKPLPTKGATVHASLAAVTEALEAYDANRYQLSVGAEHPLWGPWRIAYAAELEAADVEEQGVRENGRTFELPITFSQSTVDDPLDTEDGVILSLTASPAYSTFGEGTGYAKFDGRLAWHLPLGKEGRFGLSSWFHGGSLTSSDKDGASSDLPATKLYYGGGSNSVRAIAWEHLSRLDDEGVPVGGRSILEGGIEFRARIKPAWQLVAFVEGGRVFENQTPDFDEDILWGGGLGLRFKTPIGPLRLDVAAPFDPRDGDEEVLVYIGLGQAF